MQPAAGAGIIEADIAKIGPTSFFGIYEGRIQNYVNNIQVELNNVKLF
jgi:hypothetical protein